MRKKAIFILSILIIVFYMIGCSKKTKKEDEENIFAVYTTKAVKGEINDYIELNGDVKAKVEVEIYPDTTGKLESINVSLGQWVNKNDIIAYVNPSRPGMDYSLSPVKSTISGTVTSLPVKRGATVSIQTAIAKVGRTNELEIVTYVAEKFISKIKPNLRAIIKSSAFPEKTFFAFVSEISPVVDPVTRMLETRLKLTDKYPELKSGMFVEIKIITENKNNIIKIPEESVVKKFGKDYVFIINRAEDNLATVTMQEVIVGLTIDNKAEIVKGLKGDEEIVYKGQSLLEDNTKVRILRTDELLKSKDNLE